MPMIARLWSDQRGFTIAELLVSSVVALLIVGGAVTITSQVQTSYRRQMEGTAAEQEGPVHPRLGEQADSCRGQQPLQHHDRGDTP